MAPRRKRKTTAKPPPPPSPPPPPIEDDGVQAAPIDYYADEEYQEPQNPPSDQEETPEEPQEEGISAKEQLKNFMNADVDSLYEPYSTESEAQDLQQGVDVLDEGLFEDENLPEEEIRENDPTTSRQKPKPKKTKKPIKERRKTIAMCYTPALQQDADQFKQNYENVETLPAKDIDHYETVLTHNQMGKQLLKAATHVINSSGDLTVEPSSSTIFWCDQATEEYFNSMNTTPLKKFGLSFFSDIIAGIDVNVIKNQFNNVFNPRNNLSGRRRVVLPQYQPRYYRRPPMSGYPDHNYTVVEDNRMQNEPPKE